MAVTFNVSSRVRMRSMRGLGEPHVSKHPATAAPNSSRTEQHERIGRWRMEFAALFEKSLGPDATPETEVRERSLTAGILFVITASNFAVDAWAESGPDGEDIQQKVGSVCLVL